MRSFEAISSPDRDPTGPLKMDEWIMGSMDEWAFGKQLSVTDGYRGLPALTQDSSTLL